MLGVNSLPFWSAECQVGDQVISVTLAGATDITWSPISVTCCCNGIPEARQIDNHLAEGQAGRTWQKRPTSTGWLQGYCGSLVVKGYASGQNRAALDHQASPRIIDS